MLNRNSNLVLWLGVLAVLALSLSAGATTFNFPNSSLTNYIADPTKWETASLPHTAPTAADFLNPANTWTINYKEAKVGAPGSPGTSIHIAGPVIFHGGVGVSGTNFDRPLLFNGNDGSTYDLTNTFDDLRFQGTMRGEVTRRPYLAGNLRFIADGNGLPSHSAIQVRAAQQLNITAQIDAADCPSIDIIYNAFVPTSNFSDSQISLRNSNNKIYSQFVLDAGIYGYAAGVFGDADFVINGSNPADYRGGRLNIQNGSAISTTAKVSITTDVTGMNTEPVRIALGTNSSTIRELWVDGSKVVSPTYFDTSNAPAWLSVTGAGSLTITNATTRNVTMVASPAGDPNIRIYPPVGTKAYAENYTVTLSAPNPKGAPYVFNHWACTGATVANPAAANTSVTVPVGSDITVTAFYDGAAYNPIPVDTQPGVSVFSGLSWTPAPAQTAQTVYFGTANPPVTTVANTGNTVTSATLGRLADVTTYYWYVASTIGGNVINGPVWSFTTCNSTPNTPSPAIGAVVSLGGTQLSWLENPRVGGSTLHSVYLSTNQSLVSARTAPTITPDPNGWYLTGPLAVGQTYYWAVDATYRNDANGLAGYGTGPVWNFNAQKKILYIKTETAAYNINGAGDVNGVANGVYLDDANVINYTFPTFNYGSDWDIVVSGPKSFAIWSNASITVGGTLDISGYIGSAGTTVGGAAHAGANAGVPAGTGPYLGTASVNGIGFGGQVITNISGAGAGFGGAGGVAGRYSTCNGGAGGIAYGDAAMTSFMAGSGGGGGKNSTSGGGAGGGGAIELYAKAGNVDILSGAVIRANGGTPVNADYPAGGGSGGGVRVIASGNVTMAGAISANGGNGGNCTGTNANNTGGGGGGGRVAIYKGGTFTQTGTITATGGTNGVNTSSVGYARPGKDGTIYTAGKASTLTTAYNPAPTDGMMSWSLDPNFGGSKTLSWNPALGTTQNKLYLSTVKTDVQNGVAGALKLTLNAPANTFLRARKTYTPSPALANGTKYYWRVDTNGVAGPVWSFGVGTCSNPAGDVNGDCKVTYSDLKIVADNWLTCNLPAGSCP